ncbi:3'-5' exonuclease [Paraburkholderia acidipaludis]|uniref:3'-5' exonuclease n=1 Tax=Paraburkholderia acidipaludis TaxID=660537 RepID=UPI000486CEFB|nr:3'-5' exonuclease [Paraburkholderia acidipaludis]
MLPLIDRATPVLVVDLEATCDAYAPHWQMEIIEIGAAWCTVDGDVLDTFRSFVRPVLNPLLTPFCLELTGISQADVDRAASFAAVAGKLQAFSAKRSTTVADPVCWLSWGEWDSRQLLHEAERHGAAVPIGLPHVNAKRAFARRQRIGKEVGLRKACELVGLGWIGTHHRALDDVLNVVRLMPWVVGQLTPRSITG